ncbi:fucolectin-like isoform X2 [Rana temporaria]|uniref:fucolectin-like isoform X2 n=1 Tax=Rana temporaria TaxID=8407 RepID=UPI001AAD3A72|nr:fucolectin-like isoform X2 [Rana temporaria]XP_040204107.1 fucolectin-like isoform X2 [Rana temporaria]
MTFQHIAVALWLLCGVSAQCNKNRNVALQGRATQSTIINSLHYGFLSDAINAIDGNQDPHFEHGSCSHTHNEVSPWWRVDLLKSYRISHISITNRINHGYRLNGAEILVGNSLSNNGNNNPRCGVITSIPDGKTQTYHCHGMVGRYVNIILRGKAQFLQLCEVQVWTSDSD